MRNPQKSCLIGFTAMLLSSCTSPVDHQESGVKMPDIWSMLSTSKKTPEVTLESPLAMNAKAPVDQLWWKHFNDPVLDGLIGEALANNKTLAIAKSRVEEVRANRAEARSALIPQVNGTADASRQNQGVLTNDKAYSIADVGVQANWELDLFGKNQARTAAADLSSAPRWN